MSSASTAYGGDRGRLPVLVVFASTTAVAQMKTVLNSLGFIKQTVAQTHVKALERIRQRNFHLVVFDAKGTDMPAMEFAKAAIGLDSNMLILPVSKEPGVDDVFGMLKIGAKGFIVDPFTADSVERELERAHHGPPLSMAVLEAKDRNAALVSMILHALYRLCHLMQLARRYQKAERDRDEQRQAFIDSVELANLFCDGGPEVLREAIVEACIKRANVAATRLGRTRRKLRTKREGEKIQD